MHVGFIPVLIPQVEEAQAVPGVELIHHHHHHPLHLIHLLLNQR